MLLCEYAKTFVILGVIAWAVSEFDSNDLLRCTDAMDNIEDADWQSAEDEEETRAWRLAHLTKRKPDKIRGMDIRFEPEFDSGLIDEE